MMGTSFEDELNFLKKGIEGGLTEQVYAVNPFLERYIDLLGIVAEATVTEMEKIISETSLDEARSTNKRFECLSQMSEIACRQHSMLSAVQASVIAALKMIGNDEDEFFPLFNEMTELIARHPDLLEKKATERSLESNDTDHRTALMRRHLNSLLEDS